MTEHQAAPLSETAILKEIAAVAIPQTAMRPIARHILEIELAIKQGRLSEANHTPEARRERRKLLGKMSTNLCQLATSISKTRADIRDSIDDLLAAPAGDYLSIQAFEDIGIQIDTDVSVHVLCSREGTSRGGPYRAIEPEVAVARRLAARRGASRAIASFLSRLVQRIDLRLRLMNENKGGRPGNIYRHFAIGELADAYEQQVKNPPSTSVTGPFMKLSEQSLPLLGIELDGLEGAVERELNKRRQKK
jgi:hypothetical protein